MKINCTCTNIFMIYEIDVLLLQFEGKKIEIFYVHKKNNEVQFQSYFFSV